MENQKHEDQETQEASSETIKVKVPKRILHFSDGTLEEYSTDEDETDNNLKTDKTVVDPAQLTWGPWFLYKAWAAGSTTLSAIDIAGEFFASLFGITTPKYYFELEEFKRRQELEKNKKEHEQAWCHPNGSENETITVPLKKIGKDVEPGFDPVDV